MDTSQWQEKKVLIWGKTYPELSSKYYETVCTGGVLENGEYIRIYPIPFRYLKDQQSFAKYQWVKIRIKKSTEDPRPESYKVDPESIEIIDTIPTDQQGWAKRGSVIFQKREYQFDTVEELLERSEKDKVSMGFVRPKAIIKIYIEERSREEEDKFFKKFKYNEEKAKQTDLFSLTIDEIKSLEFVSKRLKVHWICNHPKCKGHKMAILDWEAYELARKVGIEGALEKIRSILDPEKYDVGFFLGNFRLYPQSFAIGSIWYPKKYKKKDDLTLFDI